MQRTDTASPADAVGRLEVVQAGLDLVNQGFTIIDTRLLLVAWNRAFFDMLEFPGELARVGTPFEAFMRYNAERGEYGPGEVEDLVAERVRTAGEFRPHYFERVRPNGRIIAVRGEPVPGRGFVTIYTDITEQRRNELLIREQNAELEWRVRERTEAVARSEERLRLVTDAIPALIAYFDRERIYRFANRGYAAWFGRSKEALVGRSVAEVLGPQLHAELAPHVERAMVGETVSYEYAMPRDGAATRYANSTLVPEIAADGTVSGVFVLSSDITEQKSAQAALVQAHKMEAVGQLAGGLAHDFNNMLTVVMGNLMGLQERFGGRREFDELAEPALAATRRGVELIRRLLTFARQHPLAPQSVPVAPLVDNLLRLLKHSLPENIAIRTDLGGEPLCVLADPYQLENALLNLAFNARDAMQAGGELAVSAETHEVDTRAAAELGIEPGAYVRIRVRDSGTGMSAETASRAFEPFFTTKPFGSGSGLGLAMVYGFVRQSGGALHLESASGTGTEVTLYLPRGEGCDAFADEAARSDAAASGNRLVLLVEDDAEVRPVVRRQLTELGYPVIEAKDGAEAKRILDNVADVAIVISDVVMPGGVDGHALAAHARSCCPDVRILLMSGYAGARESDWPLLAKPFSKQQLAAMLAGLER
jgi:PAS domain S-box-containing protein